MKCTCPCQKQVLFYTRPHATIQHYYMDIHKPPSFPAPNNANQRSQNKKIGEQPSNSDRKDIMQSIRVSKRYWGGHPFLRVHYDGSWTGNDQIDSLHCKRKCKEQLQLKNKKREGEKCIWANVFCYRQRWRHRSRNNNFKKSSFFKKILTKAKDKGECSNSYWHLL